MDYELEVKLLKEDMAVLMRAERSVAKFLANTAKLTRETAVAQAGADRASAKFRRETEEASARHRNEMEEMRREMKEGFRLHEERMDRIELVLAEAGDKLNGLIGYMDGQNRKQ